MLNFHFLLITVVPALSGVSPAVFPQMYNQSVLPAYAAAPTLMTNNYNQALALDAADGRIDGKFFGNNIAAPAFGNVSIAAPLTTYTQGYAAPTTYAAGYGYGVK